MEGSRDRDAYSIRRTRGIRPFEKFSKREKTWDILETVLAEAKRLETTPTELSLAWVIGRPQVTSVLIGATRKDQLDLNLRALTLQLPPEVERRLTEVSRPDSNELDHFFEPTMQSMIHGGVNVRRGV
jgi:aryl-alcohol dehydrogenase-like predicted oxidoreductase